MRLRGLPGVLVGAALAALLGAGLLRLVDRLAIPEPPPGWTTLRPPHEVTALALVDDTVWAGGRDGLLALDRITGRPSPGLAGSLAASRVTALKVDAAGRLWAAHYEGLSRFEGGEWTGLARRGREIDARPVCLLEDEGGMLVGTESGLGLWQAGSFVSIEVPERLAGAGADVLHRDPEGVLWVGSASPTRGGLWSRDAHGWRDWDGVAPLPHPSVNAILTARDGSLWIATGFANRGGACRRAEGRWQVLTRRDGLAGEKVRTIFEDGNGRLWFGSEYDGVAIRGERGWLYLDPSAGLAGREVKAMIEDPRGGLWVGTDTGLSRIESLVW